MAVLAEYICLECVFISPFPEKISMKPINKPLTKEEKPAFSRSKLFFYIFAIIIFGFAVYYFAEIRNGIREFIKVQPAWLLLAVSGSGNFHFHKIHINVSFILGFNPTAVNAGKLIFYFIIGILGDIDFAR